MPRPPATLTHKVYIYKNNVPKRNFEEIKSKKFKITKPELSKLYCIMKQNLLKLSERFCNFDLYIFLHLFLISDHYNSRFEQQGEYKLNINKMYIQGIAT